MKTENVALMQIIVNGRTKPWFGLSISFEHVVILAHGIYNTTQTYTVTYSHGFNNASGSLSTKDQRVPTVMNMIFNVSVTNQS